MKSFFNYDSVAAKIGVQLYREAKKAAYERGQPNRVKDIANAMANQFYSEILKAVDDEGRYQSAKQVDREI